MSADLFIGLVTHPRSRFADAAGPTGLLSQAAAGASAAGQSVSTFISGEDAYDAESFPVSAADLRASIQAELWAEERWRRYLSRGAGPWWLGPFMAARRAWRVARWAPLWKRHLSASDAGAAMVRRLANIEESHLRLIDEAVASGAAWVLVLEDDAGSTDGRAFGAELAAFIAVSEDADQPVMVSLSESFTHDELRIADLLRNVSGARAPWPMAEAARPVTNTVCATLYRKDFLAALRDELRQIPLRPVIPIDFKLNLALMRLAPKMRPGDAWLASPAPIAQLSGVPSVRM